jgi:hypothetical protein
MHLDWRLFVGASCAGALLGTGAVFVACSVERNGTGEVAEAGAQEAAVADAPADVAADRMETGPCTGVVCNGQCLGATDCRSCTAAPLLCPSTGACVPQCAACRDSQGTPRPIECFACNSNLQSPIGTCEYDDAGSYCLNGDYLGHYDGDAGYQCGCSDVSSCPGATQVCVPLGNRDASFCLTCGEITLAQIQGQPCKDGGMCQASSATCQ